MSLEFIRGLVGGGLTGFNLYLPVMRLDHTSFGWGLAHMLGLMIGLAMLQQAFALQRSR